MRKSFFDIYFDIDMQYFLDYLYSYNDSFRIIHFSWRKFGRIVKGAYDTHMYKAIKYP